MHAVCLWCDGHNMARARAWEDPRHNYDTYPSPPPPGDATV